MTWSRSTSPASIAARYFAIAIVVGWTLVPAICGGAFEAEHTHAQVASKANEAHVQVASHEDAAGDAHHDAQHEGLISCCRSLANAKFLVAVPAGLSPIKAVLIAVLDPVANAQDPSTLESSPAEAATGPPRTRSTRYLSYSPLAPPARTA